MKLKTISNIFDYLCFRTIVSCTLRLGGTTAQTPLHTQLDTCSFLEGLSSMTLWGWHIATGVGEYSALRRFRRLLWLCRSLWEGATSGTACFIVPSSFLFFSPKDRYSLRCYKSGLSDVKEYERKVTASNLGALCLYFLPKIFSIVNMLSIALIF